ncbi:MAG: endonuclease MutS2 [Oscillospiraceae bacterium]|nr:endonuclease MutS2 [Oscillospiraceae bacterium]
MKNYIKAAAALEFDRVLNMLADCAATVGGRQLCLDTTPSADISLVRATLHEVAHAMGYTEHSGKPSFGKGANILPALDRAERGATLSTIELMEISALCRSVRSLCDYARSHMVEDSALEKYFAALQLHRDLELAIDRAIIDEEVIADEASPALADIRRNIKHKNNKITDILNRFITGSTHSKHLQDNIITQRNGRYVVPVKAEHKGEIKGLLHDTSASGSTLFIEPMAVVETNNELRALHLEEVREIERILSALSAECAVVGADLAGNYHTITHLDTVFARAELAHKMRASQPTLTEKREVSLLRSRHPLLDPEKVVPVDIRLGVEFEVLVITGPNTGGKTVTLKTLGLFALMAQSGLFIPCEFGSSLCIFDSVFADIGDEQSLSQSLSTFSGHMKNIVGVMGQVCSRSLVLFDELGAGTDPTEGAALATAILIATKEAGALCAATTHYAELKSFALVTEGYSNASCEFNIETLSPTYRLIIGAVGRSNAFAISRRLGLSDEIITAAQGFVGVNERQLETVIGSLEDSRRESDTLRAELEAARAEMDARLAKTEADIARRQQLSEKALADAQEKAATILSGAKASANYVLAELEQVRREKESADFGAKLDAARRDFNRHMDAATEESTPVLHRTNEDYTLPRPLVSGDRVLVVSMNQQGILAADPDKGGNVLVTCGTLTTRTKVKNLRLLDPAVAEKAKKETPPPKLSGVSAANFSHEIDLRGMTGEEAWEECDKHIDDAVVLRMPSVRIIHGKGSGVLRRVIWENLKRDKRIKSFRIGEFGEGDTGVTVVEL